MAVAATVAPTGQPQEVRPLTAEQLAKNKALQDAKIKTLIKDQGIRLQQLEKPIWTRWHKIRNCN